MSSSGEDAARPSGTTRPQSPSESEPNRAENNTNGAEESPVERDDDENANGGDDDADLFGSDASDGEPDKTECEKAV